MMSAIGRRPAAAEPAHAVLHIEEECLALLLAVVADVDPGAELLRTTSPARLAQRRQLGGVDRLAARAADIEFGQRRGRGRLPAWVVRIRSWLVSIVVSPYAIACSNTGV